MSCDDQSQNASDALEAEIVKGLQSGESTPMTAEDWETIRREVRRRYGGRQQDSPPQRGRETEA